MRERIKYRVDKRCLAAAGRTDDQDVLSRAHRGADDIGVAQISNGRDEVFLASQPVKWVALLCHYLVGFVVSEREDLSRPESNGKDGMTNYRRDNALESATVNRELGFQNRVLVVQDSSSPSGNSSERTGSLCGCHFPDPCKPFAHSFSPQRAVGIQEDVFRSIVR